MEGIAIGWLFGAGILCAIVTLATKFGVGRAIGTALAASVVATLCLFLGAGVGKSLGHIAQEVAWGGYAIGGTIGIAVVQAAIKRPKCIPGLVASAVVLGGFVPVSDVFRFRDAASAIAVLIAGALSALSAYALVERLLRPRPTPFG